MNNTCHICGKDYEHSLSVKLDNNGDFYCLHDTPDQKQRKDKDFVKQLKKPKKK